ncbi:MAG: hypothetical protein ACFFD4_07625 [Candidatus Odinarchaeota archaeon]
MSWTDLIAVENIIKLKKQFNMDTAIVTGTFRGFDAELYSHYFENVLTMDISEEYLEIAKSRLKGNNKIAIFKMPSESFIKYFRRTYDVANSNDTIYFYLDAHFYDPEARQKWVCVEELKALEGFKNCVICIHDFDNGKFGHLVYEGEHFGWNIVGEHIQKVNPNFHYYTNYRTDIVTDLTVSMLPIKYDDWMRDSLKYVHSSIEKRHRGMLFATPEPLNLKNYQLVEFKC